jgi:hypothetical protein
MAQQQMDGKIDREKKWLIWTRKKLDTLPTKRTRRLREGDGDVLAVGAHSASTASAAHGSIVATATTAVRAAVEEVVVGLAGRGI